MTTNADGVSVPKQYCAFGSDQTLLERALERARGVTPPGQLVTVVAQQHREHWAPLRSGPDGENVVVQPRNRGTAPGLLLPLLHIALRAPEATVAVFPSDHYVRDEDVLQRALDQALDLADELRGRIVLLGVEPEAATPDYGYIVPDEDALGGSHGVACFVEKPERTRARALVRGGALWSSFMFTGRVDAFLGLFRETQPHLLSTMLAAVEPSGVHGPEVSALYEQLESRDLSRDVFAASIHRLRAACVPACGWSDLGTPARLRSALPRLRGELRGAPAYTSSLMERSA